MSSRIDAIKPLQYNLLQILEALHDIVGNEDNSNLVRHEAKCIKEKIPTYKFICSVVIWNNVLRRTNMVSNLLEDPSLNIYVCLSMINNVLDFFKEYR